MPRPQNLDPAFLQASKQKENARKTKDYENHRMERRYNENETRHKKRMEARGLAYVQRPRPAELVELLRKKEEAKQAVEQIMQQPAPEILPEVDDVNENKKNKNIPTITGVTLSKAIEILKKSDRSRKGTYASALRLVFKTTGIKYLHEFFTNSNFKKNVEKLETVEKSPGEPYADSYKIDFFISVSLSTELSGLIPKLQPLAKKNYESLQSIKKVSNNAAKLKRDVAKVGKTIPHIDKLKYAIYKKCGRDSLENLFISLYMIAPTRNDYFKMKIVDELPNPLESKTNYIVLPRKTREQSKIVLHSYKTEDSHGDIYIDIPRILSANIRRKEFKYNDYPFKAIKDGKYIIDLFKTTPVENKIKSFGDMRKSAVSSVWQDTTLSKEKLIEKKALLAHIMGHSIDVAARDYNFPLEEDD